MHNLNPIKHRLPSYTLLLLAGLMTGCGSGGPSGEDDSSIGDNRDSSADAGNTDNGNTDNGNTDNGNTDNGNTDNGNTDNGNTDNGNTDNGNTDNGNTDNGNTDNGNTDNGNTDNGNTDNGNIDNGNIDNGNTDNGNTDNGNTDNGNIDNGNIDNGNIDSGDTDSVNTDSGDTGSLLQAIFINEASSSNATFEDEDGDSPDWFELYNGKSTAIDLTGWSITDDILEPAKWVFPPSELAAGAYLRVWASDKDKSAAGIYKTLVNRGDTFRYLLPQSTPSRDWTNLDFNDSTWQQGASGFGYGDGDDATLVPADTASIYVRIIFTINNLELIDNLLLDMDFDDGFIAHINGVEVARSNILEATPSFNTTAITDREATIYLSGKPVRFEIDEFRTVLNDGENVLSVQVHNISSDSSDLSLIPYLSASYLGSTADGETPPDILAFQNASLHTNFKLSSKGESLTLFDSSGNQVDQLDVTGLTTDKSIGRSLQDGSLVYFQAPSPGSENSSEEFSGITLSEIVFSHNGGEFNDRSISLSGVSQGEQIRYTLDATIPTLESPLYSSAISIDGNTVVRAKVFQNGYIPSRTASRTYITNNTHALSIVTLVTEPDNLFDEQQGIYVYGPEEKYNKDELPFFGTNFWQDWERDIHFSFYEPTGELGIALDAGIKIFGAWSRANDQRSLSIFARNRYGFGKLEYPLFPSLDYDSFESIVLRNAGNDWIESNMRDVMATSLMDGSGLETQAYRPAVVYLNGEYWGFYNIREKVNEHFLDDKINVDKSEINLLVDNGEVSEGSNNSYNELINFVRNNSLAVQDNFDYVANQIDIDNLITYMVAQIYFDNWDWPGNNIKFWNSPSTKWRWILYDTDFAFGAWNDVAYSKNTLSFALEDNGPYWPNPPWSTLLFRKLMENSQFRNQFINQFADEFNGRFKASSVTQHIDAIANLMEPEMERHFERWGNGKTVDTWQSAVGVLRNFGDNRLPPLKEYIRNYFGLSGMHQLNISINNPAAGSVELNSLQLTSASWQGDYFDNVPVSLTAVANEGYVFLRWQGDINNANNSVELNRSSNTSLEAVFIRD